MKEQLAKYHNSRSVNRDKLGNDVAIFVKFLSIFKSFDQLILLLEFYLTEILKGGQDLCPKMFVTHNFFKSGQLSI